MSTKRSDIRRAVVNAAQSLAWAETHASDPRDVELIGDAASAVERALAAIPDTKPAAAPSPT